MVIPTTHISHLLCSKCSLNTSYETLLHIYNIINISSERTYKNSIMFSSKLSWAVWVISKQQHMQWTSSAWQLKLSFQLSTAAYNILNKLLGSHKYVTLTIILIHHKLKKTRVCNFHTRRQTSPTFATHTFLLSQSQQIQFKLHIGYYLIRKNTIKSDCVCPHVFES